MLNILWGSREKQIPHGNGVYDECVECCRRNFLRGEFKSNKAKSIYLFPVRNMVWDAFTSLYRQ